MIHITLIQSCRRKKIVSISVFAYIVNFHIASPARTQRLLSVKKQSYFSSLADVWRKQCIFVHALFVPRRVSASLSPIELAEYFSHGIGREQNTCWAEHGRKTWQNRKEYLITPFWEYNKAVYIFTLLSQLHILLFNVWSLGFHSVNRVNWDLYVIYDSVW